MQYIHIKMIYKYETCARKMYYNYIYNSIYFNSYKYYYI